MLFLILKNPPFKIRQIYISTTHGCKFAFGTKLNHFDECFFFEANLVFNGGEQVKKDKKSPGIAMSGFA
jgi:hypothetical protein